MKKIKYSPDAKEKLNEIKREITSKYGNAKAKTIMTDITKHIRGLQQFENKGISVEDMLGIPCDYRLLFVRHNYVFYNIKGDVIQIVDIFNEKEDFMRQLFGIITTSQETLDYWKE